MALLCGLTGVDGKSLMEVWLGTIVHAINVSADADNHDNVKVLSSIIKHILTSLVTVPNALMASISTPVCYNQISIYTSDVDLH